MHRSIRDRLEDLLSDKRPVVAQGHTERHLAVCPSCASELDSMKGQAALLRELRAPADVEPAPGFYARVLQRIEERARNSAWGAFIESAFSKRLAFASLAVAVGLGSYVVAAELSDGHLGGVQVVAQQFSGGALVTGNQTERRDAVLVDFAAYHPGGQPFQEGSTQ